MEFEKININKKIIDYLNLKVSEKIKYFLSEDKKTIMYTFEKMKKSLRKKIY